MVRKIIRSTTLVFALYYLQLKPTVVLPVDAQEPMRGASGEVVTMRTSLSGTRGWSRWGRCTPTSTTDTGKTRSASTKATLSGCGGHSTAYWLIPPMTTIVRFLPTISPSISRTRLTPPTRLLTRRRCTTFHAGWRLRRCHRRRGRETDQLCAELGMPARSSAHVACYRHELAAFALRRFVKNKSLACVGCFPAEFKEAIVRPLLNRDGLDLTDLENYRPVQFPTCHSSVSYQRGWFKLIFRHTWTVAVFFLVGTDSLCIVDSTAPKPQSRRCLMTCWMQ